MSTRPDVSVVMGVYNGDTHLAATMESVLSQDGVKFEFIVVNDGSRDKTKQILNDYAKRDDRVRIIHQENTGLTRALVCGCNAARGEFIARQDAGDISLPGRLKSQVTLLRDRDDCVFASCWTDIVGPRGEYLYSLRGTGVASTPVNILSPQAKWGLIDGPTHHSSVMFRTEQYVSCGGYRPEFYYGQDSDLWYRLASLGTFCTIQKKLCVCRINIGSISGQRRQDQEKFAKLSRKAMLMREKGMSDEPVLAEARSVARLSKNRPTRCNKATEYYFIGKCLVDNHDKAAIGYLLSALKEDPLHLRAWLSLVRSTFVSSYQAL